MSNGTHYEVLARKYRPQNFSELAGQEHVSRTLQNAIDSGRVAHAFLFTGARGVGKTSTARIMAKTLNCEKGVTHEPCNVCPQCIEITKGTSTDVFEIDGASNNGVDDVRDGGASFTRCSTDFHARRSRSVQCIGISVIRLTLRPRGRRPSSAPLTSSGERNASESVMRRERGLLCWRVAIASIV